MKQTFEMVAKTFRGLEDVLAEELRAMGALNVEPGLRMVAFEGDLEMMYRANLGCRTALRILKPICRFRAASTDELYAKVKEYDWSQLLSPSRTFSVDPVVYSDVFTNSRFVTYRVKDAIVDYFKDRLGQDKRPGVRTADADVLINVHIADDRVTLSLDSSGESLHKRGYRVAQTEAPINEVLAAGILLKAGYRGDTPLIDPMCGSGTFLVEAALIAANIMPGIYRRRFAFEQWPDFDAALLDSIYNDDSAEREVTHPIIGADISAAAIAVAQRNVKSAGVGRLVQLFTKSIQKWTREEVPEKGILVMNPPYGERISADNMDALYSTIGTQLKHVFLGYHAWIIAYREEHLRSIGLSPSLKMPVMNGSLECELREYVIFDGSMSDFRRSGGKIKEGAVDRLNTRPTPSRKPFRDSKPGSSSKGAPRPERPGRDRGSDRGKPKGPFKGAPKGAPSARANDTRRREGAAPTHEGHEDNPLNSRRSASGVRRLKDAPARPSLPPMEGPLMRDRRRKGPDSHE